MNAKQKKLMLLGGLRYLLPVIDVAHQLGIHVITCDYLPDNIAHKYSDEYCNVSIIDKDAVLQAAQERQIDGIMSFAVDPGVTTAAYVQEKMGLPGNPYESVCILQNKDKFRQFLATHGFNTPWAYGFSSPQQALDSKGLFSYPCIVKPTDSAGSKGVTQVNNANELEPALLHAIRHSLSGHIIVEEFIEKAGCSSDSDCFSLDGELRFASFSSQRFDESAPNPYTPAAFSWPSTMTLAQESYLKGELQRLISLLHLRTSIYNVECRVGTNGKPYIMEVSPRGGGNRIAEMLRYATGVDLITASVRAAVGLPVGDMDNQPYQGHWMLTVLHAKTQGKFQSLDIAEAYRNKVVETDLWVTPGDEVNAFCGANDAIGSLILRLDSSKQVEKAITSLDDVYKIRILP